MKCAECEWKYPNALLNPMFINGKYTLPICGICALALVNSVTGGGVTSFTGTMAESIRLSAIEWREQHPNDGPKAN